MRCKGCPAVMQEGFEYPEEYCRLGEKEREFNDGSIGCNRKSLNKIKKDIKIANKLDTEN